MSCHHPSLSILEQTRNNTYGATRVPIVPLFVLLGIKFLYCMAVFGLAIAAYQFTNPSESQSVKERLSVKGLAATCFAEANTHQQVAVQNVEQLFQQPKAQDAEAAPTPEVKVGMVMTELGGWAFVKLAAGKVLQTVAPIVQADVMAVAKGGQFGSDGQSAAGWISLYIPHPTSIQKMSSSGGSAPGEFAHGKVDPSEAGKKGGLASGGGTSDSGSSGQSTGSSGNSGSGGSGKGEFAHGKVDPSEAGKKGGSAS
ncbi:hypothetical protein EDD37DRAFT_649843 [Exophiala viscosa]|uniref:Uncharacterized protein n=1 Tax=Exophiala viscosa TaxID=2486360 RepID=A0AAN6IF27_9EURO|nr:hypothetical protein EDD36DRAFT_462676 [Exophiala viscosa]KAI1623947.1 hypothetical protein EDD37DRAFT_649843 [Exophiala viscosa]